MRPTRHVPTSAAVSPDIDDVQAPPDEYDRSLTNAALGEYVEPNRKAVSDADGEVMI